MPHSILNIPTGSAYSHSYRVTDPNPIGLSAGQVGPHHVSLRITTRTDKTARTTMVRLDKAKVDELRQWLDSVSLVLRQA